ncbi:unnamed protein product [Heterobilharzia americana]|nr:unnamed protein product [Heterobilharzia americana]
MENKHPSKDSESANSMNADLVLLHLLIDCLKMFEPHPNLFLSKKSTVLAASTDATTANSYGGDDINADDDDDGYKLQRNHLINRIRMESLIWLGAKSISVSSLLDLAIQLMPKDVHRPGLLSVLLSSLEACLSAEDKSPSSSEPSSRSTRSGVLATLRYLRIFPLTNGQCIRLDDRPEHSWAHTPPIVLLPPHPSEVDALLIGITYDDYIQMLSKLGPLVKPDAFHNHHGVYKEFSYLLINESPIGLGLQIATPFIVLKEWIIPYLKDLYQGVYEDLEKKMNWCLTIGQFYASIDMNFNQLCITSLCEYEFPTMLPIVVSNKLNENRILPALCSENGFRRMESIFLPPASFTIITPSLIRDCNKNSMEELEVDLFKFLVDQINDSDCIYTVSSRYFQEFSTDQRQGCRWFNLFSGAGVCTLLSVHKVKYVYQSATTTAITTTNTDVKLSTLSKDIIQLPKNHRLEKLMAEALSKLGSTSTIINESSKHSSVNDEVWLIEDYISPGMDLLLTCISRLQDKTTGKSVAERLSCLLHDNWSSYEAVQSAFYKHMKIEVDYQMNSSTNISKKLNSTSGLPNVVVDTLHYLSYASWLNKLRETAWLPVEQIQPNSPIQLLQPINSQMIYSPSAFFHLESQNPQLSKLLKETCYIWSPGGYILKNPPDCQFTKAIGLINQLAPSTFESLMKCLGHKAKENPLNLPKLTPDLMLFIYRTAVQYYLREDYLQTMNTSIEKSLTYWLRSIFANSAYPCILVQCPRTITSKYMCKRSRKDNNNNNNDNEEVDVIVEINDYDCPICHTDSKLTPIKVMPRKRFHWSNVGYTPVVDMNDNLDEYTPIYHLVNIDIVCWQSITIDHIFNSNYYHKEINTSIISLHDVDVDKDEDISEYLDDQCILINSSENIDEQISLHVKTTNHPRVFALSKCYNLETRQFFIERLGLPSTSTIDEVLALRPNLPNTLNNKHKMSLLSYTKSLYDFNKQLSQWYALLDYCLREEYLTQCRLNDENKKEGSGETSQSIMKQTKRQDLSMMNIDAELNKSHLLVHLRQFPILLDSTGQWHRPCDVVTLLPVTEGNDSNISSSTSLSTVEYTDKSSKICLFAWSKPIYARMIHEEVYCKQLNRKDNNTDVISSSMPTSDFPFRVMAQSLGCLHARYVPVDSLSKRIPSSAFSSSLLLDQFTSSSSSSRQYHCEGTAHGLLLDLFGLPVEEAFKLGGLPMERSEFLGCYPSLRETDIDEGNTINRSSLLHLNAPYNLDYNSIIKEGERLLPSIPVSFGHFKIEGMLKRSIDSAFCYHS